MKIFLACLIGALLGSGCSTVQVARLDTTLKSTQTVDLYKSRLEVIGKTHREIGYLAYDKLVSEQNYTKALGALLNKARRIGAEALVVETPFENLSSATVFRGTAIVYEP